MPNSLFECILGQRPEDSELNQSQKIANHPSPHCQIANLTRDSGEIPARFRPAEFQQGPMPALICYWLPLSLPTFSRSIQVQQQLQATVFALTVHRKVNNWIRDSMMVCHWRLVHHLLRWHHYYLQAQCTRGVEQLQNLHEKAGR